MNKSIKLMYRDWLWSRLEGTTAFVSRATARETILNNNSANREAREALLFIMDYGTK